MVTVGVKELNNLEYIESTYTLELWIHLAFQIIVISEKNICQSAEWCVRIAGRLLYRDIYQEI